MSIQAVAWVLDSSESEASARLVLLSIANHCDKFGADAFPSMRTIASEARLALSTVQIAIDELERLEEIQVVRGGSKYGTNLYAIPKMPAYRNSVQSDEWRSGKADRIKADRCTDSQGTVTSESVHNRPLNRPNHPNHPNHPSQTDDMPSQEDFDSEPSNSPRALAETWKVLRIHFKSSIGKSLGAPPRGRFAEQFADLVGKNGPDKVIAGFDEWMETDKRDFIRESHFAFAIFMKDPQGWIDDAATEPEVGAAKPAIPEVDRAKKVWE